MAHEADREVWLNFLDEVDEYLNTIESVLIGLAERSVDPQGMAAALRAAHTIKGIGSMIECPSLSHLAHRFEDSLKIVNARRDSIQVDTALEMLLLQGLDSMRQISLRHRQALPIEEGWLGDQAYPAFEQLHNCLGEIQPSDELALLAEESEANTAVVMFETEVEELLERLASVLATPGLPCLQEELEMMVEELHDLGKMLQLDAFTSLCESIHQELVAASPHQIEPIAHQALKFWQRSQALVMVGKLDKLPTHIEPIYVRDDESEVATPRQIEVFTSPLDLPLPEETSDREESAMEVGGNTPFRMPPIADGWEALVAKEAAATNVSGDFMPDQELAMESANVHPSRPDHTSADSALPPPATDLSDSVDLGDIEDILSGIEAAIEDFDPTKFQPDSPAESSYTETVSSRSHKRIPNNRSSDPQIEFSLLPESRAVSEEPIDAPVEPSNSAAPTQAQDFQENTVRVPIKLLTQLNDLFGELIIQRNTMNSRMEQMEDLMNLFSHRMVNLESTNTQLQTFCNQIAVETSVPAVRSGNGTASVTASVTAEPPPPFELQSSLEVTNTQQEFDSLELDRYSGLHLLSQEQRETLVQLREVTSDVKLNLREIKQASGNLNRTAKALQTNVTRARMLPLSDIVERFPRTVRDLALRYGKTVDLKIHGGATLIDRFVAVQLRDPLIHLLRNAFDHGIEDAETRRAQGKPPQGTIEIRAAHRGNQTLISMRDDGAGININKIRDRAYQMGLTDELINGMSESDLLEMIFEPGFSTADQVTNLSGRGIGMDVVRTNLEQLRGEIKVDTQPGMGTTFTISVPFTLSIVRVLLVESGGMRLAFPTDGIEEMIRLKAVQVFESPEQKVINWDGLTVPLINLDQWFEFRCPLRSSTTETTPIISEPSVLIVSREKQLSGIYIDRFWGEREVVIRQVENVINLPPGFSGCTILEDGHVVPLANATELLDWIESDDDTAELLEWIENDKDVPSTSQRLQHLLQSSIAPDNREPKQLALPQAQQTTILVVDDSINMRQLLRTTLEQAGYSVEQGKDGQDAVDQLLGGLSVHAVICDIEMPRLDGYGLLAEVRADDTLKDLPIIMLTSRGSEKHRQLAMRLGAAAYITKPYQDHELLQTLEQVLQDHPLNIAR